MLDQLTKLKEGKTYTYAGFTEVGGMWSVSFKLKYVRFEHLPDQGETAVLAFTPIDTEERRYYKHGKHSALRTVRLFHGKQFLLWEDIVFPNLDVRGLGLFVANNPRALIRAKVSVTRPPVCEFIKELAPTEETVEEIY